MSLLNFEVVPLDQVPLDPNAVEKYDVPVVLVVDDERIIADTLSIILRKNGFKVLTAYDGEMALELAETSAPALLLSDVMMGPGMDGTQLAIALRRTLPDCKVMLFSGNTAARDLLEKASALGHDFKLLQKPLHPADLLAQIQDSFAIDQVPVGA